MAITDVISELNRIQQLGLIADYAIGGAVAAQAYIESSATVDIDVFIVIQDSGGPLISNLGPIWTDLVSHGAKEEGEYLVIGGWPVQLLPHNISPLYQQAVEHARTVKIDTLDARIMGPEYLAAIALATGRAKDFVRVEEFVRRGKVDMSLLKGLIERFGLRAQWKSFELRFLTPNA
jgi:hypothetical protein